MDMTISVADFSSITNYTQLLETIEIPEGTPINMGERSYPFYIGEYSSSQTIEWLEPRLIIDTKDLPSNTTINIKIYTKNDLGEHSYFWLPNNYSITLVNTPVKVIETITNIDQFRNARTVFIDVDITYPTDVTVSQIINDKINIKFAIRFALKINL
jgi:hypothetical protein